LPGSDFLTTREVRMAKDKVMIMKTSILCADKHVVITCG
jgi:hypothetical protein